MNLHTFPSDLLFEELQDTLAERFGVVRDRRVYADGVTRWRWASDLEAEWRDAYALAFGEEIDA